MRPHGLDQCQTSLIFYMSPPARDEFGEVKPTSPDPVQGGAGARFACRIKPHLEETPGGGFLVYE